MGMPHKYLDDIPAFLSSSYVLQSGPTARAAAGKAQTGIRQGCSFSPYLFILVMSVLMRNVPHGLNMARGTVDGFTCNDLLYADDKVLVTSSAHAMDRPLARVEDA